MSSKFFSEPRALLLKISLPTEGITKTVLIGFNATLADVRQKLLTKLSSFQIPHDINNWAFLLTQNIDQMWLDDKVSLKSYNIKDGDLLEFKRKVRLLGKISNMGPWVKAAPQTTAIYEHQLDRPISPEPKGAVSPPLPQRTKTSTDKLFDALFEEKEKAAATAGSNGGARPPASTLASTSSPFNTNKRRNSTSRRKSKTLVSLLTKVSTKDNTPKPPTPKASAPKPIKTKKTNSAESKVNPLRTTPPAMLPSSPSPGPRPVSPPPPAPKQKKQEEITEEEMIAWLEMEGKDNQQPKQQLHDVQEISLSFASNHEPVEVEPEPRHSAPEPATSADPETDFHLQIQKLETEFAEKSKAPSDRALWESTDSASREDDGYVRREVTRIEESDIKDRKARRRSRTASDARLSLMVKRTTEMEQQFNNYIAALTEQLDSNERTLDTVSDLLYNMIKRIDEGQLDVKGARRFAKKALDIILEDAKQRNAN